MQKPKKWTEVYPQGTKEGDEEQKMFIALARHPKYEWRSISALAKASGLSEKRVEEILAKYHKFGMVFQSPSNEENWGYWERVPQMLNADKRSIPAKDQDKRIKDASASMHSKAILSGFPPSNKINPHVKIAQGDLAQILGRATRPEVDSYEEAKSINVCLSMSAADEERFLPPMDDEDFWKPITPKSDKRDDLMYFETILAQRLYGKPSDECFPSSIIDTIGSGE